MNPALDVEPRHEDLRRLVRALGDAELDQWTTDPESYILIPAQLPAPTAWSCFELAPTAASQPVSALLAVSDGEILITSGNAEAMARVVASAPALDDESLAGLVFELWRPRGRSATRVPGTARAWRDESGRRLAFDVDDRWNGIETWTALIEPGRARVDTWGAA